MTGRLIAAAAAPALLAALAAPGADAAPAQRNHIIEAAAGNNAADFVIDGAAYRIVGECTGWRDGDRVVFADGSTAATCGSVQITNIDRDSTCRLECR